jgi:hypothetical protein
MVRLQTLDLRIGVRVPASQPTLAETLDSKHQNHFSPNIHAGLSGSRL